MTDQLDLFSAPPPPLIGLVVQLPTPCQCGAVSAKIEHGRGPHLAGLRCDFCGRNCGRVSRPGHQWLAEVIARFGRPTKPIEIRTKHSEIGASALTTAPQGAGAVLTTSAP